MTELTLKVSKAQSLQEIGLGRARIGTDARKALGVESGDFIEVTGKRTTVAKVYRLNFEDEGKGIIRLDGITRSNAKASLGETVTVRKADLVPAERITIAPRIPKGKKITFGRGVEEYMRKAMVNRAFVQGDEFVLPNIGLLGSYLPFVVLGTEPKGVPVIIQDVTELVLKDDAGEQQTVSEVRYEDIGGLDQELQRVREMIELPLKHPEMFERLGIQPPKGVLLYGPPGTGKTLIAKAVANEAGASFFSIQGPEIIGKYYGESEERLRAIFEKAKETSPAVVFIDEIDSIAPKRDDVSGEVERRVVAQLLTLMDGLNGRGHLIVIAATNRVDAIDPALRRPGRFDREIEIGVPTKKGRKEILQIHTRGMPLEDDFDIDYFARITYGFVGADLEALAREAAMKALRRYLPEIDIDKPIPQEILLKMRVTMDDFRSALREVEPSAMREVLVDIPSVNWSDVGGLDDVKELLRDMVELPLKDPKAFEKMGVKPPKGILLYGPPGTGKTLLAKAVASESEANFISIKGPEVMSKWVGESEKAVREIFKRAKQVAPAIVFIDEIDSIVPRRGMSGGPGVTERVVNQLLTSMDGLESLEGIIVMAATNRPDIIDPALLRPGRFDRLVLVPAPDERTRESILKVKMGKMPVRGVSAGELAKRTEGYSGADLEGLCREAALSAIKAGRKTVTPKDFEQAFKEVRPSLDEKTIAFYEQVKTELKKAAAPGQKDESYAYYG